jgi:hypothetical protein
LCTQPSGSTGTIKSGPTIANNYTWWNIDFAIGCDGWSVQNYLTTTLAMGNPVQVAGAGESIESLTALIQQLEALLKQLQR